jgi:hypothetical protein
MNAHELPYVVLLLRPKQEKDVLSLLREAFSGEHFIARDPFGLLVIIARRHRGGRADQSDGWCVVFLGDLPR